MKIWNWLSELDSHDIYDADGVGKDFVEKTGEAKPWTGVSHKVMRQRIIARGLSGSLAEDNGHPLISGYEIAEILAEKYVPGKSRHRMLQGRGSRFYAALEALKQADV